MNWRRMVVGTKMLRRMVMRGIVTRGRELKRVE